DELIAEVGSLDGRRELVPALRVFDAATTVRSQVAAVMAATIAMAMSFDDAAGDVPVFQRLTGADARLDDAIALIENVAAADSAARVELDRFRVVPSVVRQLERIDELVAAGPPTGEPPSFVELLARLDEVLPVFEDGVASIEESLGLVEQAGADATDAVRTIAGDARSSAQRIAAITVAVALLVIAASALLVRTIVRPLRRLSEGAGRVRDGELDHEIRTDGPLEISEAAHALNDATSGLRHFRDQIDDLARGEVPEPVLAPGRGGPLDDSIRAAVDALTASMRARAELRERLAHEASHDGLTHLPNRRASLETLRTVIGAREAPLTAVMFVDLDDFKDVNDHAGHRTGDVALTTVAERLVTTVGTDAHVGRLGGDEFIVIVPEIVSASAATDLGRRIVDAVAEPIISDGNTVELSTCVGVALTDHVASPQELLREADVAVYEAKRVGPGVVVLCDDALRDEMHRTSLLDLELRHALVADEFEVWLQPVVDAVTLEETSREALIRWRHPDRGLVPPGEFIPFAERSELIADIDRWVIGRVVELLAEDPDAPPIAVNASGRHLCSERFFEDVVGPLAAAEVDGSRIVIEVTESAVMDDVARAAEHLRRLREIGVRVAVDDFGTGYASLSYLRELPVDVIKIDRSFTRDADSRSLVKMVVETARLLGLSVTAEGVEEADQVEMLRTLGVDRLQGYHLGRPAPSGAATLVA
ncbi:MAG: sensor domain-containing phosphodiesterase, partial [Actinomycetota bacterium]